MVDDAPSEPTPWHAGELSLQASVGAVERMAEIGRRNVRGHLTRQHVEFYPLLPFVVIGSVDAEGQPWATLRAGRPGFVHAVDDRRLALETGRVPSDPAEAGFREGASVGLLGIELPTRRRNRMNGRIERGIRDGFVVAVEHAFGNCPQYIRSRDLAFRRDPRDPRAGPIHVSDGLDARARACVERADTFFVATYVDREGGHRQVDVSHRGGEPGFVRVDGRGRLTIPDYRGNRFFNTLGNILANPRAGLAFVDFRTGDMLQSTGRGEVVLDPREAAPFSGAERVWRFEPGRTVLRQDALPLRSDR